MNAKLAKTFNAILFTLGTGLAGHGAYSGGAIMVNDAKADHDIYQTAAECGNKAAAGKACSIDEVRDLATARNNEFKSRLVEFELAAGVGLIIGGLSAADRQRKPVEDAQKPAA